METIYLSLSLDKMNSVLKYYYENELNLINVMVYVMVYRSDDESDIG